MAFKFLNFHKKKERSYFSDNKGVTAIEFAIIAPAFLILFIGIFELGFILLAQTSLETGLHQVVRFGRTGDSAGLPAQQETAAALMSTYTFGVLDPSKVVLTVTPYPSFSAMPLLDTAPTTGTQNFGTGSQPVLYVMSYQWNFFTPLVGKFLSQNGEFITLKAAAAVQNEPF